MSPNDVPYPYRPPSRGNHHQNTGPMRTTNTCERVCSGPYGDYGRGSRGGYGFGNGVSRGGFSSGNSRCYQGAMGARRGQGIGFGYGYGYQNGRGGAFGIDFRGGSRDGYQGSSAHTSQPEIGQSSQEGSNHWGQKTQKHRIAYEQFKKRREKRLNRAIETVPAIVTNGPGDTDAGANSGAADGDVEVVENAQVAQVRPPNNNQVDRDAGSGDEEHDDIVVVDPTWPCDDPTQYSTFPPLTFSADLKNKLDRRAIDIRNGTPTTFPVPRHVFTMILRTNDEQEMIHNVLRREGLDSRNFLKIRTRGSLLRDDLKTVYFKTTITDPEDLRSIGNWKNVFIPSYLEGNDKIMFHSLSTSEMVRLTILGIYIEMDRSKSRALSRDWRLACTQENIILHAFSDKDVRDRLKEILNDNAYRRCKLEVKYMEGRHVFGNQ